jgi:hypothetical protein
LVIHVVSLRSYEFAYERTASEVSN